MIHVRVTTFSGSVYEIKTIDGGWWLLVEAEWVAIEMPAPWPPQFHSGIILSKLTALSGTEQVRITGEAQWTSPLTSIEILAADGL